VVGLEILLGFVALTRAKRSLYFLDEAILWLVLPDGTIKEEIVPNQRTKGQMWPW